MLSGSRCSLLMRRATGGIVVPMLTGWRELSVDGDDSKRMDGDDVFRGLMGTDIGDDGAIIVVATEGTTVRVIEQGRIPLTRMILAYAIRDHIFNCAEAVPAAGLHTVTETELAEIFERVKELIKEKVNAN